MMRVFSLIPLVLVVSGWESAPFGQPYVLRVDGHEAPVLNVRVELTEAESDTQLIRNAADAIAQFGSTLTGGDAPIREEFDQIKSVVIGPAHGKDERGAILTLKYDAAELRAVVGDTNDPDPVLAAASAATRGQDDAVIINAYCRSTNLSKFCAKF